MGEHRLTWHDAHVAVGDDGAVGLTRAGQVYLAGYAPSTMIIDDGRGEPGTTHDLGVAPALETLPDEIELTWPVGLPDGRLTLAVRHAFGPVWSQRWVLRNHTERSVQVRSLAVALRPVAGAVHWLFAGGAESSLSVQPLDPTLPTLGVWVQRGEVWQASAAPDGGGLDLGPVALPAHGVQVIDLSADFFPSPAQFARTVHRWLPSGTYVGDGQPVRIVHPDAAITKSVLRRAGRPAPRRHGEENHSAEGVSEFVAEAGTAHELEFHDARGCTAVVLYWAPALDALIGREASRLLAGPRAGNGVARLPGPLAGLMVQRALAEHAEIDPEDAADALDLLTARTDAGRTPWDVLFACGEYPRSGDPAVLDEAIRTVTTMAPQPGLGVAGSRAVVTMLAAGRDPTPVLQRLAAALSASDDLLVRWELLLVAGVMASATASLPGAAGGLDPARAAAEVTTRLGSGLLGRAVPDADAPGRARLVALLSMMVEAGGSWQDRLGERPAALADHAGRRILWEAQEGRVTGRDRRAALAWLMLADDLDAG